VDKRPFRVIRWLKRSQRGQALIEFAIGAPLLAIMLLGLVEFGHALNSYLTVVASARDAARLGAQEGIDDTSVTAMLNVVSKETERLTNTIDTSTNCPGGSMYVCITSNCPGVGTAQATENCTQTDKQLKVQVCYDHPTITGVPSILDPMHMCSSTTIRIAK
jgi:Flp pilus assembly protein TadG